MRPKTIIPLLALLAAACTNDTSDLASVPCLPMQATVAAPSTLAAKGGNNPTRALAYNWETDVMDFSWNGTERFLVFPNGTFNEGTPVEFRFQDTSAKADGKKYTIVSTDQGVNPLASDQYYIAFVPYKATGTLPPIDKVPVSYEGQQQNTVPRRGTFYNYLDDDNTALFVASEVDAAKHLADYDYQVSLPTLSRLGAGGSIATSGAGIDFNVERVGAVGTCFITVPGPYVYTHQQLVTQGPNLFTLAGTLNTVDRTITPTKQAGIITLKGEWDFSDTSDDKYYTKGTGYLETYFMIAPVDLSHNDALSLYLTAHEKTDPTAMHYFRADNLDKPNLTPNMFYRWTLTPADDNSPIEFEEITVEEWKRGTNYENSGHGTENW